jgi:hypothetical protein
MLFHGALFIVSSVISWCFIYSYVISWFINHSYAISLFIIKDYVISWFQHAARQRAIWRAVLETGRQDDSAATRLWRHQ